jgi:hypothetical protein
MSTPRKRIPPPSDVLRQLRKEVGMGCPICRKPFLTWHHFDPPYHVEEHNRPDGMIALCLEHAAEADQGNYSTNELRKLKSTHTASQDVMGSFPSWQKPNILVRFGGNYAIGDPVVFRIQTDDIITLSRNDTGMLSLSFVLNDADDNIVAVMKDNVFEAFPQNLHDLEVTVGKKTIRVWFMPANLGLEVSFARISLQQLHTIIERDEMRTTKKTSSLGSGEHHAELMARMKDWLPERMCAIVDLTMGDTIGPLRLVRKLAAQLVDDNGLVALLNFKRMMVYHHGKVIGIAKGITDGSFQFDRNQIIGLNCMALIAIRCSCNICCEEGSRSRSHRRAPN